ncbi:hypothetical protein EU244_017325 [Rhodococcus qingshengii]|uniref:hypothetical protein n=1 Tax=Rhodococcus qingshengii TaxID=334542 RepID=UPI0010A66EE6|nr:hypothetical protein [Rhodococcus qingshengii]THJ73976.1 hypothetical protein EU244_00465 [Rhodococcus qingshengii]
MRFPGLDPTEVGLESPLHPAQRFLAGAYDSVAAMFEITYPALRSQRDTSRGRLTHAEQDIFRAAVVFAGAGIDTVMKEAVRGSVRLRIDHSDDARAKYLEFAVGYLQKGSDLNVKSLASLLISERPDEALKNAYVEKLTGSSLQSVDQVITTLSALGLTDQKSLYLEAKKLKPLFQARNQISHELDMTSAAIRGQGQRTRHERTITTYRDMCHIGLNYSQKVLNSVERFVAPS